MNSKEFVQDVLQLQEGVILDDLWPCDEKFREIVRLTNMAIREFNSLSDWTFLKRSCILGDTHIKDSSMIIPRFHLPDNVLKVSTLFGDCLKLYSHNHNGQIDERFYIEVPYASPGFKGRRTIFQDRKKLLAVKNGRWITFNRMPIDEERNKVVVAEVQTLLPEIHECDFTCRNHKHELVYVDENGNLLEKMNGKCCKIEKEILPYTEIRTYFTLKVASMSSRYSPPAGAFRTELGEQANQALSKLKTLDGSKTFPNIYQKPFIVKIRTV